MSELHGEYLKLLDGLAGTLDQLADVARKKVKSTREGDLEVLNQCMKEEQVVTLSLKTFEKKRIQMLGQLGLQDVPLNQLSEHFPDESRRQARNTVENLQRQFERYQSASTAARSAMERALRDIERMLPDEETAPPGETPPNMRTDFRA